MRPTRICVALLALGAVIGACADRTEMPQSSTTLVLMGTSIVDVASGSVRHDQTIVVRGDRIVAIGQSNAIQVPEGATRVDAREAVAIPGLWDMHVHTQYPDLYSLLYIANGVTGVRDMGGDDPDLRGPSSAGFTDIQRWRERISNGELPGPQVIAARSIIDGPPGFWPFNRVVMSERQARELVREEKAAGSDFVKVYSGLRAPEFRVVIDEARQQGLEVHGHLSEFVGVADAIRAGQRTIEHFSEGRYLIVTASGGTEIAERYQATITSFTWLAWLTIVKEAAETHDSRKAEELVSLLASSSSWQVPTWRQLRYEFLDGNLSQRVLTLDEYVPEAVRQMWADHPVSGLDNDPELVALGQPPLRKLRELLDTMRRGNVRFLAGSDSGNPGLVPGFALHQELTDLVEEAGFTTLEALQMATLRPAEFLGELDQLGTIEVGKRADIVLLRANPLEDIRNTREIEAVIVRGEYMDRSRLDSLLVQVRRSIEQQQ